MRRADAPIAGWYPDPQHRSRLRWWDGLDWTDIRRAPPSDAELIAAEEIAAYVNTDDDDEPLMPGVSPPTPRQVRAATSKANEVRNAIRSDVDRAARQFGDQASRAVQEAGPLIEEYGTKAKNLLRRVVVFAVLAFIAYYALQAIGQAALMDWISDVIKELDEDSLGAAKATSSGGS